MIAVMGAHPLIDAWQASITPAACRAVSSESHRPSRELRYNSATGEGCLDVSG